MLYRAVRELLVNVAKHAKADHVDITLDREDRSLRITVEDDGKGFDPSLPASGRLDGSFGICSVRERLTRVGGEFIIDSVEGRGTRVILIAPLDLD
jgi:two-component system, NarL family, sensor kinase